MEKYEYNDWSIDINEDDLISDDFYFNIRMMGFDPDTHSTNNDFKKWHIYYNPQFPHNKYYGDGILPYIENTCLKYESNETQRGYLKQKTFHPNKIIHRETGNSGIVQWKRIISDKTIVYKPKQNFLCELIEFRKNKIL